MLRQRTTALRAYQVETLQSLLDGIERSPGATFTVMYPRQAGKNEVAAHLVAALLRKAAQRGGSVVVCAPSYRPQARISLARAWRVLAETDHLLPAASRARMAGNIITAGRAAAVFLSAAPQAHVAGHTASLAIIADEAQDIERDWFDRQFRPMAASTGAPTVLFGTAWDGETLLERATAANRERDAAQTDGRAVRFHHEVSWQQVAAPVPAYGAYVEAERERLGASHPLFLTQYELVPARGTGRLLSVVQLAALEGGHDRLAGPRAGERYVAGLDLAGPGAAADATVLTVARADGRRCEVVEHVAWRGAPFERVEREVAALARVWRLGRLSVDATGMGAPLAAGLQRELGPIVEAVTFTAAVKSALGYAFLAAVESGRLALYRDDGSPEALACRLELRACRSFVRTGAQLAWGDDRGHDDFAVSLALCLRAAESAPAERVAVGRSRV